MVWPLPFYTTNSAIIQLKYLIPNKISTKRAPFIRVNGFKVFQFKGFVCEIPEGEADLSNLVRDELNMPNLYVPEIMWGQTRTGGDKIQIAGDRNYRLGQIDVRKFECKCNYCKH